MTSLYETLLLPTTATESEIKAHYYMLCKKYHPNRSASGSEKYTEIQKAYTILKDPHTRDFYDSFGERFLVVLNDERSTYLVTRVFNWKTRKFLGAAFALVCVNMAVLPYLLYLYSRTTVISKLHFVLAPMFLSLILFNTALFKSAVNLLCKKKFEFHNEIVILLFLSETSFLMSLQVLLFTNIYDGVAKIPKAIYLVPYIIFEIVLVLHIFMIMKRMGSNLNAMKKVIPKAFLRILLFHYVLLDIGTVYKLYLFILWLVICMVMEKVHWVATLPVALFFLGLVTGCLNYWLVEPRLYLYVFLFVPYSMFILGFGIFRYFRLANYPISIFKKDRLPIEL